MPKFRYKTTRTKRITSPFGKPRDVTPQEVLTGFIDGDKASDIEERFARALRKIDDVDGFGFRVPVIEGRNLPGQLEVDFMVTVGPVIYPIQVDGEYAHKTSTQKQEDALKDALIDGDLKKYGARAVQRIPGDDLETQEEADKVARSIL